MKRKAVLVTLQVFLLQFSSSSIHGNALWSLPVIFEAAVFL